MFYLAIKLPSIIQTKKSNNMTPCRYPACPTLLPKSGYCDRHKASQKSAKSNYDKMVRAKDPALALAYKIRKSAKWLKIRKYTLASNPICADPFGDHERRGTTGNATQVHHIKGLRTHPELWNVLDNLQCLCTRCHSKIEQEVRRSAKDNPEPSMRQIEPSQQDEQPSKYGNKYF